MAGLQTGVRVRAEGFGITSKTVVTFIVLVYDARRVGGGDGALALLAFAGGQLAYGAGVLLTYIAAYGTRPLWPQRLASLKCVLSASLDWSSTDLIIKNALF